MSKVTYFKYSFLYSKYKKKNTNMELIRLTQQNTYDSTIRQLSQLADDRTLTDNLPKNSAVANIFLSTC